MNEKMRALLDDPVVGKNLFVKEVGGNEYILRRKSSLMMMQVRGASNVLGLVAGAQALADDPAAANDIDQGAVLNIARETLALAMVFPRLAKGDESTTPGEVYAFDDLGDDALELFVAVTGGGEDVDPMPASSPETTAETP